MRTCIGIYLRLSQEDMDKRTNRAKDESNSIAAQRQLIQRQIAQDPYLSGLPQREFCDDGFSGTSFARPDFQRMIGQIRAGEIQIVIVKDLSRFGRDYLEVGDYLEHIFPFLGVRMISINDHYDSARYRGNTAGMDVAFRNLIYDYYSKDLSRKVKSAMHTLQRNGGYVSCCLYGYQVLPGQKHRMVIDPRTAPVVRRVFRDVIAGKSTGQIARELNAEGVPTPLQYKGITRRTGEGVQAIWTHTRIIDMVKNLKYTGCMVNHTRESMTVRAKSGRRLPREEWIIHENAHEAIVTREEYEAAQAALRQVRPHKRKHSEQNFPYYCAHCGRKLQRTFGTDEYFYCPAPYWSEEQEDCKAVRWSRTELETVVLESLKGQLSVLSTEAAARSKQAVSRGTLLRQRLKALAEEVEAKGQLKVQRYIDYREGRMTREDYAALRQETEARIALLKEQLAQTEGEYEAFLRQEEQAQKERAAARRTGGLDEAALKAQMYDAVERIEVADGQSVHIVWKFEDLFASA